MRNSVDMGRLVGFALMSLSAVFVVAVIAAVVVVIV
jgi:hypothetical protein